MTKYDNPVFEVNGEGSVTKTLDLLLELHHSNFTYFTSWRKCKEHGLILYSNKDSSNTSFIVPLTSKEISPIIAVWLDQRHKEGWATEDRYFDGSTDNGWLIYYPDIPDDSNRFYIICAVKPIITYYGK